MDFTQKYKKRWNNLPFSTYTDQLVHNAARKDALAILDRALQRTYDEDVRTEEVYAALEFLRAGCVRTWPFENFERWLDYHEPRARFQNLNAALNGIRRTLGEGGL